MTKHLPFLMAVCLFAACNENLPDEKMLVEKAKSMLPKNQQKLIDVEIVQVGAAKSTIFGQEHYQVKCRQKLVASQNLHGDTTYGQLSLIADTSSIYQYTLTSTVFRPDYKAAFKKGDVVKETETVLDFVKTGNGWQ